MESKQLAVAMPAASRRVSGLRRQSDYGPCPQPCKPPREPEALKKSPLKPTTKEERCKGKDTWPHNEQGQTYRKYEWLWCIQKPENEISISSTQRTFWKIQSTDTGGQLNYGRGLDPESIPQACSIKMGFWQESTNPEAPIWLSGKSL